MTRYKLIIFLAFTLSLFTLAVSAQNDFLLTGKVMDDDMNPVELASVSCLAQGRATITNMRGEFSLSLSSADSVVIKFSMIGYKSKTRVLRRPRGRQNLQITLSQDETLLDDVTITEKKRQTGSTEELDITDMKQAPSTTGNAVEEMIQTQAGVSSHNELSSQYNAVRSTRILFISTTSRSIVLSSSAQDSRKVSVSSIPIWLRASVSLLADMRQNMATRCHRLLTSPTTSHSARKGHSRQVFWEAVLISASATRNSRGLTEYVTNRRKPS